MNTLHLASIADLDTAIAASSSAPVLLFKHSTRCPVSFAAEREYLAYVRDLPDDSPARCYHLDLIRHRDVSNAIADRLGVQHQSPQAILLVNGRPVWDASHYDISAADLATAFAEHAKSK